jgi:hypothetical protein
MMQRLALQALTAGALLLASACGSNALVIGGDPEQEALSGVGGSAPTGAGGTGSASFDAGSSGASAGGSGGSVLGGAGNGGSGSSLGGDYPWVVWAQGRGYEQACAPDGEIWGATCWNHSDEGTAACESDGTPFCNVCNCMISCATGSDCPAGRDGQPAVCLDAGAGGLCFVSCEDGAACPAGMVCSRHPEAGRDVCMWPDGDWESMPTPR